MGSKILDVLRKEEKKARLRFWRALMRAIGHSNAACPFADQMPPSAVFFGTMPKNLRGAFLRAFELRSEERRAEAEIFEEAMADLLQEHFNLALEKRAARGEAPISQFRLGADWAVYAVPVKN